MVLIGGAGKNIIGGVHGIPYFLYLARYVVNIGLWADPGFLGLELDLLPMLVGARLEKHIIAVEPFETRYGVGQDDLVCVPYMGLARGICYGCCNEVFAFIQSNAPLCIKVKIKPPGKARGLDSNNNITSAV